MKHLRGFNEANDDVVIIGTSWMPIIAWSGDVKDIL